MNEILRDEPLGTTTKRSILVFRAYVLFIMALLRGNNRKIVKENPS